MTLRVLLLADTHLGFDLPTAPRVRRRRRGHDFQANFERALNPALEGEVDLVIHGGDVFHRPDVPPSLAYQAFRPLQRVAEAGVPVVIVPGNHERGRIPHARFGSHPNIRIFDRPCTYRFEIAGHRVALSGFPYLRRVRERFVPLVDATGRDPNRADIAFLCVHHCVEGATVGPSDFTFRRNPDVIRGRDIPRGFAAVVSGHIHRHQVLTHDLSGRALAAPVLYPGSVDRTAFAEKDEAKGYIMLDAESRHEADGGEVVAWRFEDLDARPMVVDALNGDGLGPQALRRLIRRAIERVPPDSVLRLKIHGRVPTESRGEISAARVRAIAPEQMNVEILLADEPRRRESWRRRSRARRSA